MSFDPASYALGKSVGGGSSVTVEPLSATENKTYAAPEGTAYSPVVVNVPNTYSVADNGKVVVNQALAAQTAHVDVTPTTNDQVIGTTANNSVKIKAISPTKAAQTYTPTTSDQTIQEGRWLSGAQTIKGDANLVAENIKNGVTIFGVTGSYSGGGGLPVISGSSEGEPGSNSLTILAPQGVDFSQFNRIQLSLTFEPLVFSVGQENSILSVGYSSAASDFYCAYASFDWLQEQMQALTEMITVSFLQDEISISSENRVFDGAYNYVVWHEDE